MFLGQNLAAVKENQRPGAQIDKAWSGDLWLGWPAFKNHHQSRQACHLRQMLRYGLS
jgi:hypothetical protein